MAREYVIKPLDYCQYYTLPSLILTCFFLCAEHLYIFHNYLYFLCKISSQFFIVLKVFMYLFLKALHILGAPSLSLKQG